MSQSCGWPSQWALFDTAGAGTKRSNPLTHSLAKSSTCSITIVLLDCLGSPRRPAVIIKAKKRSCRWCKIPDSYHVHSRPARLSWHVPESWCYCLECFGSELSFVCWQCSLKYTQNLSELSVDFCFQPRQLDVFRWSCKRLLLLWNPSGSDVTPRV